MFIYSSVIWIISTFCLLWIMPKPCTIEIAFTTFMSHLQYFKDTTGNIPLAHTNVGMMPLKWKNRPFLFSKCSSGSLLTHSKRQSWAQTLRLSSVCSVSPGSILCLSCPAFQLIFNHAGHAVSSGPVLLACPSSPRDLNGSLCHLLQIFAPISTSWEKNTPVPTLCFSHPISLLALFPLELILSIYFIYLSCLLSIFIKMQTTKG